MPAGAPHGEHGGTGPFRELFPVDQLQISLGVVSLWYQSEKGLALLQPNNFSAAGFIRVIVPARSTMIIPSRMFSMMARIRISAAPSFDKFRRTRARL